MGSDPGIESWDSVVKWTLGCLGDFMVDGFWEGHFLGKVILVPGMEFWMMWFSVRIRPFSAKDFRCMNFMISVLVRVSGAPKLRGGEGLDKGRVGKTCSKNLRRKSNFEQGPG